MAESKDNTQPEHKWSTRVYRLADFLDLFQLPQTIKVSEGYLDDKDEKTLSVDDVLVLHGYEKVQKVFATTPQGEEVSVPLTCAVKVDRVCEEFAKIHLSGADILHQLSKVKFVRVVENDTEVCLAKHVKLKVKYKTVENHGTSFSFLLSTLKRPKQVFKITQDCKATFQAVLDAREYHIAEVVRNFELPYFVWIEDKFIQDNIIHSFRPEQNVLKLEKTFTENFVVASMLEDSNSVIKLPKNLEITLYASVGPKNQLECCEKFCRESSNDVELEKYAKKANERAESDEGVVYEEMTFEVKETEIASVQRNQVKQEIKIEPTEKLQMAIANNYTTTPLVGAINNGNGNYDIPKPLPFGRTQLHSWNSHESPLYDSPRQSTRPHNDISVDLLKEPQSCFQDYAPMERIAWSDTSVMVDESEDHIYQEIPFLELPKELKGSSFERKEMSNDSEKARKVFSKDEKYSSPGQGKADLRQNSNTYQIDRKMADKRKQGRDYQAQNAQTDSDQVVYENYSLQERRLSEGHFPTDYDNNKQRHKMPQMRRASAGGCLVGKSPLSDAISDALLKNKLFVKKAEASSGNSTPPQPPLRTSSIKPELPQEDCCVTKNSETQSSKTKASQALPKPSLRRSASTLGTFGNAKDKIKFAGRPLPDPVATPQATNLAETLKNKDLQTTTPSKIGDPEKTKRTKPQVPSKASTLLKIHDDKSGGKKPHPRDQRGGNVFHLEIGKPASLPETPKIHPVDMRRNKFGNQMAESEEQLSSTPRENRSHSLNELDILDDTFRIPDDLRSLGVAGVIQCLKKLKMEHLVDFFETNQIDGDMLLALDDDVLSDMKIEKFHRLKLVKFITGWRPLM